MLAALLDAAVLVDPAEYRRRRDEPTSPGALRMLTFGTHDEGLVTFLVDPPGEQVLVVKVPGCQGPVARRVSPAQGTSASHTSLPVAGSANRNPRLSTTISASLRAARRLRSRG